MADADEDAALRPSNPQSSEDAEFGDEFQDFRFLAALTGRAGRELPRRGEKDFEPHGTKHQDGILSASRQAMHDALNYTRIHGSKSYLRAFYYGVEGLQRDDVIPEDCRQGLEDDRIVLVEYAKGIQFKTMGKTNVGKRHSAMWLLPEEALYLVERGTLDLWWPSRSSHTLVIDEDDKGDKKEEPEHGEEDQGFPMSLQAAFSLLIGQEGEPGKVTLERYAVYANLKRTGYCVFRAPDWDILKPGESYNNQVEPLSESQSTFSWLFGRFFAEEEIRHSAYGPLVTQGMYRSYNSIYRQIAIIPRHKPSPNPSAPVPAPYDPYRVVFLLWKSSRLPTFSKKNPGVPDFRVAITDARSTHIPSLTQFTSLLESTPWAPPEGKDFNGHGKLYHRLRHGWRNVVLAVVDMGVISYLRLGEVAFGEEKLYRRFDGTNNSGPKRGGGAGRGRGRGRGRGGR